MKVGWWLVCCGVLIAGHAWSQQAGAARTAAARARAANAYPSSTEVGEASITVDRESRQIIVVTDDETAEHIGRVISNLDRPTPQVLIKVVFMEITYRKGLDVGVEGQYTTTINRDKTLSAQNVFGLASLGATASNPAGLYQILGDDFQATLRAISEAGKTEILSRPSILARNNQQAIITVGQNVPLITSVRFDNFGNQINGVTYRDIGIILRVTPFITSEGMVEMIVSPEISELSEQSVLLASGTNATASAPIINVRSADTVVVTPDGQTVVIGGLMSNSKRQTDSKIPLLGDIPLLGNLFKRKVKNDTKTELLIFLTPYIVQQPGHLAAITETERANSRLAPRSFTEDELDRFLDRGVRWNNDLPPPSPDIRPTRPQ